MYTKSGQGTPHLMNRQNWLIDNFSLLHTHIMHHCSSESAFKPPEEGTVSMPPDARRSEDPNQPVAMDNMSVKSLLISGRHT